MHWTRGTLTRQQAGVAYVIKMRLDCSGMQVCVYLHEPWENSRCEITRPLTAGALRVLYICTDVPTLDIR